MIKRTPYTSDLIPIGNENMYEGKPVYTDGRIAYGWTHTGQYKPRVITDFGGFWVGEETAKTQFNGVYKLAVQDLSLSKQPIGSRLHGQWQCYPCYAEFSDILHKGILYSATGAYEYTGAIVAMSANGKIVTYNDYKLTWYNPGSQKTDQHGYPLKMCYIAVYGTDQGILYLDNAYISSDGNDTTYIYDTDNVQVAELQGNTLYYSYNGTTYTGKGGIEKHNTAPALNVNTTVTDLSKLRYLNSIITGIMMSDTFKQNEHELTGYDIDAKRYFTLANTDDIYFSADTPDLDDNDNVFYVCTYNTSYTDGVRIGLSGNGLTCNGNVFDNNKNLIIEADGAGNIDIKSIAPFVAENASNWNVDITGAVPARDSSGNIIYIGTYRYEFDWLNPDTGIQEHITKNGDCYVVYDTNETIVYNMNDSKIASEDNATGDITVVSDPTAGAYTGPGILVTNTTGTRPKKDSSGNIISYCDSCEFTVGDMTIKYSRQAMYTVTNNGVQSVYDNNTTYAEFDRNNNKVTTFDNIEYNGAGTVATNISGPLYSKKVYHVNESGIDVIPNLPATWHIGPGATLSIPDLALKVTDKDGNVHTYNNDPLGLIDMTNNDLVWPGGVHACGDSKYTDYVISQQNCKIWHDLTYRVYNGIENCFNLSFLRKRF